MTRAAKVWVALAWIGYAVLPWHLGGSLAWLVEGSVASGSGLALALAGRAWWLLPIAVPLLVATRPLAGALARPRVADWLVRAGLLGLILLVLQGASIGVNGWTAPWLASLFGAPGPSQGGMGPGAALTALAFLMLLCGGLAGRGWCRGDAFVVSSIGLVVALIAIFVFFPVATILASAFADDA